MKIGDITTITSKVNNFIQEIIKWASSGSGTIHASSTEHISHQESERPSAIEHQPAQVPLNQSKEVTISSSVDHAQLEERKAWLNETKQAFEKMLNSPQIPGAQRRDIKKAFQEYIKYVENSANLLGRHFEITQRAATGLSEKLAGFLMMAQTGAEEINDRVLSSLKNAIINSGVGSHHVPTENIPTSPKTEQSWLRETERRFETVLKNDTIPAEQKGKIIDAWDKYVTYAENSSLLLGRYFSTTKLSFERILKDLENTVQNKTEGKIDDHSMKECLERMARNIDALGINPAANR